MRSTRSDCTWLLEDHCFVGLVSDCLWPHPFANSNVAKQLLILAATSSKGHSMMSVQAWNMYICFISLLLPSFDNEMLSFQNVLDRLAYMCAPTVAHAITKRDDSRLAETRLLHGSISVVNTKSTGTW